jgi:hypothetical protein
MDFCSYNHKGQKKVAYKKGKLVHIAPACAGSGEGFDHFES